MRLWRRLWPRHCQQRRQRRRLGRGTHVCRTTASRWTRCARSGCKSCPFCPAGARRCGLPGVQSAQPFLQLAQTKQKLAQTKQKLAQTYQNTVLCFIQCYASVLWMICFVSSGAASCPICPTLAKQCNASRTPDSFTWPLMLHAIHHPAINAARPSCCTLSGSQRLLSFCGGCGSFVRVFALQEVGEACGLRGWIDADCRAACR